VRENVTVVALIEVQTDDASLVRSQIEPEDYVEAFYELFGRFNVGIIVRVQNEDFLFEVIIQKIRMIPGVKETRTHLIQDGVVI
jgi:DNA-binding Lrp family transcriptional regulator